MQRGEAAAAACHGGLYPCPGLCPSKRISSGKDWEGTTCRQQSPALPLHPLCALSYRPPPSHPLTLYSPCCHRRQRISGAGSVVLAGDRGPTWKRQRPLSCTSPVPRASAAPAAQRLRRRLRLPLPGLGGERVRDFPARPRQDHQPQEEAHETPSNVQNEEGNKGETTALVCDGPTTSRARQASEAPPCGWHLEGHCVGTAARPPRRLRQ
jgi:hypothetical protein